MSKLSTWRVGGLAEELFLPADCADMQTFLADDARAESAFFIGHGSNLLVRDGGIGGVVVRTAPGLSALRYEDDCIYAEAGVGCPKLARFATAAGFAEAAFLAGVPGTVGGALAMNAGCDGGDIWRHVQKVLVLEKTGPRQQLPTDFIADYRSLRAKDDSDKVRFFAAVWLRFAAGDAAVAAARMRELLRRRRDSQPLGAASCGSVFCNPPGDYAAKLIDSCGLKGAAVGGARVSDKHANFIINDGAATAADIEKLLYLVRQTVQEKTGVCLLPEVKIVGREHAHASH